MDVGSVSRSALRLNLSRLAMSHELGRLRELLQDPFFIRQGFSSVLGRLQVGFLSRFGV